MEKQLNKRDNSTIWYKNSSNICIYLSFSSIFFALLIFFSVTFILHHSYLGFMIFGSLTLLAIISVYLVSLDFPKRIGISKEGIHLEYKRKSILIEWKFIQDIKLEKQLLTDLVIHTRDGMDKRLGVVGKEIQNHIYAEYGKQRKAKFNISSQRGEKI